MMWEKYKPYAGFSVLALAVGALAGLLTRGEMEVFAALNQPPLSPPGWLFPVVWTVLYLLMGISMGLIWRQGSGFQRRRVLELWCVQLGMNFLWTLLFFNWQLRLTAFFWLLALLAVVAWMVAKMEPIDRTAAKLQIPYLVWLLFAGYLNFGVYLLNR